MALNHSPSIVTNGLTICLDAANSKSYSGSGTAWNDISGNGNNAILEGTPTYSAANNGSFVFNGTSQSANLGNVIVSTTAFSASAWVYDTDTAGGYRHIIAKDGQFLFRIDSTAEGGNLSAFVYIAGTPEPRLSTAWTKNVWANVCFVWNTDGTLRLFINGVLKNSSSTRTGISSTNTIFRVGGYTSNYFKGNISNSMFYNRTLTNEEVLQNFNALKGRYGI